MTDPNITAVRIFNHWINGNKDNLKVYRKSHPDLPVWKNIDKIDALKGNGEIFEARWKNITITCKDKAYPLEIIEEKLLGFLDKRFIRWVYCVEHISTNTHIHLSMEFGRKKYRPSVMKTQLAIYFPDSDFDLAQKDGSGKCHLRSKTLEQSAGFIGYIQKDEPDKCIKFSDSEFKEIAVKFKN